MKLTRIYWLELFAIALIACAGPAWAQGKTKAVTLDQLGQPFDPRQLDAAERAMLKKLEISEDLSLYQPEQACASGNGRKCMPRLVKISGIGGRFVFLHDCMSAADGGAASCEIRGIFNLATGDSALGENALNISYWSNREPEEVMARFFVNDRQEMVSFIQVRIAKKNIGDKAACSSVAILGKVEVKSQKYVKARSAPLGDECFDFPAALSPPSDMSQLPNYERKQREREAKYERERQAFEDMLFARAADKLLPR